MSDEDVVIGEAHLPTRLVIRLQTVAREGWQRYKKVIKRVALAILLLLYSVYLGAAVQYNFAGSVPLIVITTLALTLAYYRLLNRYVLTRLLPRWQKFWQRRNVSRAWKYCRWLLPILTIVGMLLFACIDGRKRPIRMLSILGLFVHIFFAIVFSKDASKIQWHQIVSGIAFQLIMALLIVRWNPGYTAFRWLGEQVTLFLRYSQGASLFLFGENYAEHDLIFGVLPNVFFFGAVTEALYYFGILQWVISAFGSLMAKLTGFGPLECFISAANIFLGANASALTVARWLGVMTLSELHLLLTSGFATVTGGLLGAYILFGVPPTHIITASVVSAPAALVIAKLMYPERHKSKLQDVQNIEFPPSQGENPSDAYRLGALAVLGLATHVGANLLCFVGLMDIPNTTLAWLGERVGVSQFTLERAMAFPLVPVAFFLGVERADCLEVGRLLGTKLILTDIVAYRELGRLIRNRQEDIQPFISERSEVLSTYALCGFASFPDIAICVSAIGSLCPLIRRDLAKLGFRAMVAGNMASFLTACIAGMLYEG